MLKTRIIPTLLWKNYTLVKGTSFDSWRRVGTIVPAINVFNTREVDEIMVLDIEATREGREPDYDTVAEFSMECEMPMTIGGGIASREHVRKLLAAGADKVLINSASYDNLGLITESAKSFGSQCIVAGIDARCENDGHMCYSRSGTQPTGKEVAQWAKTVAEAGAGEILITSIENDGMMQGYDLELIRKVADSVDIPVIAQGGAGGYEDMYRALHEGHAQAVSASSIFLFTEATPLEAKKYLAAKGIPVRNVNMGGAA
jgi:imidazole glycerol-phosphate synthase subunit HisF